MGMPKLADPNVHQHRSRLNLNKGQHRNLQHEGKYWYSQCSPTVDMKGKHIQSTIRKLR